MKKLYLLLLLPLLAWCSTTKYSLPKDTSFKLNMECQQVIQYIKEDAERDVKNSVSELTNFTAFYSPVLNECVVTYIEEYYWNEIFYAENIVTQSRDKCIFKYYDYNNENLPLDTWLICSNSWLYFNKNITPTEEWFIFVEWDKEWKTIAKYLDLEIEYLKWNRVSAEEALDRYLNE